MNNKTANNNKIIPVAAMMICSFCVGIIYIWSAYKATAESYYSWSSSSTNLVPSIMLFAFTGGCFIGGLIQDRTGPKKTAVFGSVLFGAGIFLSSLLPSTAPIALFYLTYSVLSGFGSGFVYNSTLNGVQKWFPDKIGLATGLGAGAFGLSTVLFSPLCTALLSHFSMPVTLRIFAILTFSVCMIACCFIRIPEGIPAVKSGSAVDALSFDESIPLSAAIRRGSFWVLFLVTFFYNGTWNMLTPLIKGLGIERGLDAGVAVLCLSLTGITNTLGRIIMSSLSDKIGRYLTMYILCAITAVGAIGLTFIGGSGYFAAVLIIAFAYGGPSAVNPALCTDLFGPKYSGSNYGFVVMGLGVSSIFFNAVSNGLYAAFGNYLPTFVMGAATAILSLVLIMLVKRMSSARRKDNNRGAA